MLCGGEFGRTPGTGGKPGLNPADGRDHWPHGFSIALAGGGIRGGITVGETSPDPKLDKDKPEQDVADPKRASRTSTPRFTNRWASTSSKKSRLR